VLAKLAASLATRFSAEQIGRIEEACAKQETLEEMAVDDFVSLWGGAP